MEKGFRLLERIELGEAKNCYERVVAHSHIVESIHMHLAELLNTHMGNAMIDVDYGLPDFNDGKAIFPLVLNNPSAGGIAVKSGYSSKGNNSQFNFSLTGQTLPVADAASQVTAALSTYVLVETTATMMIAGSRSVAMSY